MKRAGKDDPSDVGTYIDSSTYRTPRGDPRGDITRGLSPTHTPDNTLLLAPTDKVRVKVRVRIRVTTSSFIP
jgi:hypothetical protein